MLLKSKLVSAPILGYPDVNGGTFILDTDASSDTIGAVLSQIQNGQERVIAYGSRTLSTTEKNYCVTRKEMLALVFFVKHFKHYLLGREFTLRTDHGSLVWLHKFKDPDGQIARWLQQLAAFTFKIQHRPGKRHGNADSLSRMTTQELSCKQCKLDVTEEYSGPTYHHVRDLRTLTVNGNSEIPVFPITDMFSDSINSDSVDTIANRPSRARPKKQPEESLTLENIREAQLNDKEICKFLKWIEDPDFQKPPISLMSGFGFESKFLYSRWELLTVKQCVLCIKWIDSDCERFRIYVPRILRDNVMWNFHDAQTAGHRV